MISDKDLDTAVLVLAHVLGIDIENEGYLLKIAKDALKNLPANTELGIGEGENAGIPFYFNVVTGKTTVISFY